VLTELVTNQIDVFFHSFDLPLFGREAASKFGLFCHVPALSSFSFLVHCDFQINSIKHMKCFRKGFKKVVFDSCFGKGTFENRVASEGRAIAISSVGVRRSATRGKRRFESVICGNDEITRLLFLHKNIFHPV
jgi:hypothetical protein